MDEFSDCLPLSVAVAVAEQLLGGSRHRLPWDELRKILDDLTVGHAWLMYPMSCNWRIFRGRICNENQLFANSNELTHRVPEEITGYGRCHQPHRSIFYASNNLDTVFAELEPEVGDRVHVAVAGPNAANAVRITAIGEIEHVRRYGVPLIGNHDTTEIIQDWLGPLQTEESLRRILIDAFLSDIFSKQALSDRDYKLTSALSDIIISASLNDKILCDGFAYPSVAHRGGINYALDGDRFYERMAIYECMVFEITVAPLRVV